MSYPRVDVSSLQKEGPFFKILCVWGPEATRYPKTYGTQGDRKTNTDKLIIEKTEIRHVNDQRNHSTMTKTFDGTEKETIVETGSSLPKFDRTMKH